MLRSAGYLACIAGIAPVVGLALAFTLLDKVTSVHGAGGLVRRFVRLLEFVGSPWKMLSLAAALLALLAAGCLPQSRPWACLVVGILGLASLFRVVALARPTTAGELVVLVPSAVATVAALIWAGRWLLPAAFA